MRTFISIWVCPSAHPGAASSGHSAGSSTERVAVSDNAGVASSEHATESIVLIVDEDTGANKAEHGNTKGIDAIEKNNAFIVCFTHIQLHRPSQQPWTV